MRHLPIAGHPWSREAVSMKTFNSPGSNALRIGRQSIAGQRYLITTRCDQRETRFAHWASASRVAAVVDSRRLWRDSRILCWVLMPDHMHLLIELGENESLPALMRRVKCVTAGVANAVDRRRGRVWMPGYHDHALRCDESVASAVRYMVVNPVRANLVRRAGDYPYWNCVWLEDGMADWE
jgi:putative transposase